MIRWITRGRLPDRRRRFEVATFLGVDEGYIWPDAPGKYKVAAVSESEIVAVWPRRSEVPRDAWGHLFSQAEREIGVLVYSGLFLSEDAGVQKIFKDKAKASVRVRILLGEPDSQVVADRGGRRGCRRRAGGQDPQCAGTVPAAASAGGCGVPVPPHGAVQLDLPC